LEIIYQIRNAAIWSVLITIGRDREKSSVALLIYSSASLLGSFTAQRWPDRFRTAFMGLQSMILKLTGINGTDLLSYVAKLKKHNIDQTVLGSLTFKQLHDIGIAALGDRLKIYNFFSKDINDCNSLSCQNNGICRDGFRCFSCICDPNTFARRH
jgi:hypothetical protein